RHPRGARHHERAVPGEEGRARSRRPARGRGRRSREDAAAGEAQGAQRRLTTTPVAGPLPGAGAARAGDRSMAEWPSLIAAVLGGGIAVGAVFYVVGRRLQRRALTESTRVLEDARQRMVLAAKEELMAARETLHRTLDQKLADVDRRDQELRRREQPFDQRAGALGRKGQEIPARLEQVAGLSAQDAKQELVRQLEDGARNDAAALVRDIKEQAKKNADREAKKIVALAIQRIAADQTAESSVAAVPLPSDEMKGRIIGREGR